MRFKMVIGSMMPMGSNDSVLPLATDTAPGNNALC